MSEERDQYGGYASCFLCGNCIEDTQPLEYDEDQERHERRIDGYRRGL